MLKLKSFCFIFTLLSLLMLGGCTENNESYNNELIVEGRAATISLKLNVKKSKIETRAATDENILHNIYIYIFNEAGELDSRHYIVNPEYADGLDRLATLSGNNKQIHAVANIGLGIMSITKEELDKVMSLEDLENTHPHLLQQTLQRGSEFLMSGDLSDENGDIISLDIKEGGNIAHGNIILTKLDAKVTFNITSAPGVTFRSRSWQALRISSNAALTHHKNDSEQQPTEYDRTYFDSDVIDLSPVGGKITFSFYALENSLNSSKDIPDTGLAYPGDKYYDVNGEEIEAEKLTEEVIKHARYSLRDKRIKELENDESTINTVINGAFEYANENSTYVKIIGVISYPDPENNGVVINGTVEYTIHLGYAQQDQNDYKTNANTKYIYNVHIVSAKNIIVEAMSDNEESIERQPGVEGVAESIKTHINVDSHFETSKFTINETFFERALIPGHKLDEDEKFFWYIDTPFESKLASNIHQDIKDYKWVYFRLNKKDADGNYNDFYETYKNDIYKEEDSYGNTFDVADYLANGDDKLITVAQLNKLFNIEYAKYYKDPSYSSPLLDAKKEARFTVFINEFYYKNDPSISNETVTVDKLLWKKFVNKNPRTMGISTNAYVSADNNSIYITTEMAISQASIQTIYNVNADGLNTAWGSENYPTLYRDLESSNPVRRIPFAEKEEIPESHKSTNLQHGLANTLHLVGGVGASWTDIIDPTVNQLSRDYQLVRYACMQRNRDLNGNGRLDKNEIRWYLASINQLGDLWIGEGSLRGLVLYNGRGILPPNSEEPNDITASVQWGEELYASSSISGGNVYHLWSAEGSSLSLDSYVGHRPNATTRNRSYRCLRDLGFDDDARDFKEIPQDVASYDKVTRIMDLKYLNTKSLRGYSTTVELPTHHGRDQNNLPRLTFEIAADMKPLPNGLSKVDWHFTQEKILEGYSFCPIGYRMPNQRELALMVSRIVGEDGLPDPSQWIPSYALNGSYHMLSRTSFSLNPLSGDIKRPSFAAVMNVNVLNLILTQHGKENEPDSHAYCLGIVRCVKDLE